MIRKNFLIIRRDNIGDLVCTTPMIHALRQHFPDATIDALVNSYNAPVLAGNPDLNHVFAYTKAKHRTIGQTKLGVYWQRLKLMLNLRQRHYDYVILAGGNSNRLMQLARWLAPAKIISHKLPLENMLGHEVEHTFCLLLPLGITGVPPKLQLQASSQARTMAYTKLNAQPWYHETRYTVAIHISARKLPQRWATEKFSELIRCLHAQHYCQFVLFWSPGDEFNALHPGDDNKAAAILSATQGLPVLAYPTHELHDLIGGLSLCQIMICADGGAMHIGAALGLPIVCFFGNSDAQRWHPWAVPYELLQKPSLDVSDLNVAEVTKAYHRLRLTCHMQ